MISLPVSPQGLMIRERYATAVAEDWLVVSLHASILKKRKVVRHCLNMSATLGETFFMGWCSDFLKNIFYRRTEKKKKKKKFFLNFHGLE